MTETTEQTKPPWKTRRWTPLEGGGWKPGMRAEYTAEVGTPDEIANSMTPKPPGPVSRTIRSGGFTDASPREFAQLAVAKVADEDDRDPASLAAVVWDMWPTRRWDGQRNSPRNPHHALDVYTRPAGGDEGAALRTALLTRLRIKWEEGQQRDEVIRLWTLTHNISQIHQMTGLARTTLYQLLRAEGYEPTDRTT